MLKHYKQESVIDDARQSPNKLICVLARECCPPPGPRLYTAKQLLNGILWNSLETFMVLRGWNQMALMIPSAANPRSKCYLIPHNVLAYSSWTGTKSCTVYRILWSFLNHHHEVHICGFWVDEMFTEWTGMKSGSDIDVLLSNSCDFNIAPSSDQSAIMSSLFLFMNKHLQN